jgi:hypothetical protein
VRVGGAGALGLRAIHLGEAVPPRDEPSVMERLKTAYAEGL